MIRPAFSAQHATRIALGAYYNAIAASPRSGPELVGAWMEALSKKLASDEITRLDYAEIMRIWQAEDNAKLACSEGNNLPLSENAADNGPTTGSENA